MGETIEVRLNDAQHRQLMEEARDAGQKFFDYCRTKLTQPLYGTGPMMDELPKIQAKNEAKRQDLQSDDRMNRIEDAIAALTQMVTQQAGQPIEQPNEQPIDDSTIDVSDMVSRSLDDAERQGLTAIPREQARAVEGGVRHVGRKPPTPFTLANQPKHLAGL